ncbi:MAG: peptidase M28 [Thaumarchaeota archaeon]|nr:MAG: peptidase M28 [Nitrososphaerota archaeon]
MKLDDFTKILSEVDNISQEMYQLMKDLYPLCRSITGNNVRKTHEIIRKHLEIQSYEVPTGTEVYDWVIPKEWNINDAYVIDPTGKKIIDFKKSNLHIVNYSIPVKKKIFLTELKKKLHTLPKQPDSIPYLTSYYSEDWGFCLTHNQFLELIDGEYEIVIDSSLDDGHLTYGEYFIKGKTENEILITCYTCHPSLCNDNLSGVTLVTFLAKYLSKLSLNYSYRFLFIPETIGAIAWLSINEKNTFKIKHGLVATCLGDSGSFTYKKSRRGNAEIDQVVINVLQNSNSKFTLLDFFPSGSDERQFCSPGFNLPVGSLMKTMYGKFDEYHTSADNLEFVNANNLKDSITKYIEIIFVLENNAKFLNLIPKCEPQLSKRGLYDTLGGQKVNDLTKNAIQWILNLSDGENSLLDISNKSGINFNIIVNAANMLIQKNLLQKHI